MTVRVDAKLKAAAKRYLIAKFGSTCRGIEAILAALLKANAVEQHTTVYRQPTTNINFEKVLIERNLKTRRKKVVMEETEVTETVKAVGCSFCQKTAIAIYEDKLSNIRKYACRFHGNLLEGHPKWLFIHAI